MIGQLLAHYRVLSTLGSGGMGEVFLARDTVLDRFVALKVLRSDRPATDERIRRFVDEARAASALTHPNIATIHQLGEAGDIRFIVMEYVDGTTLKDLVSAGPIGPDQLATIATQIAQALEAAHAVGIIHRDIKSGNIMMTSRGVAKVLDFGLAKRVFREDLTTGAEAGHRTSSDFVAGTVPYMSPEQALGKPLDCRSDIFSFGVVLYELATARLPFWGATSYETVDHILHSDPTPASTLNPAIPSAIAQLIARCLDKRKENRPQSAGEVLACLRATEAPPPARAAAARAQHNLPQQLTRFVGRRREVAEIRDLWKGTRLVTLTGPGGIGKSRLSLEVAFDALPEQTDGVWFVGLASLADPDLVPQTVAASLGVRDEGTGSIAETLAEYVRDRRMLLLMDNCEHLVRACAQLIEKLLMRAPHLNVLATSREALAIAGERLYRVSSLESPDPRGRFDLDEFRNHEAVELLIDRAQAVKPSFTLTSDNATALATVCTQLDGIPLAIELAASRVNVLSLAEIADRLHDRLNLLTGGSRTAMPRHQTLLAAIEWSYNLLSEPDKALFRRLSVFAGGWTLEAAETVCHGTGLARPAILEVLAELVDKSLVLAEERHNRTRYRFMETLREYAAKCLASCREGEDVRRAHAEYFLALATQANASLMGTAQKPWLDRLHSEHDNIRSALTWAIANDVRLGLRLAGEMGRYWYLQGFWDEARRWLADLLSASGATTYTAERISALNAVARIAENQGDYEPARVFATEALDLARAGNDKAEAGVALNCLAILSAKQGDSATAQILLEQSLQIRRALGDKAATSMTLSNLGTLAARRGRVSTARTLFAESLDIARDCDYTHGIAIAMLNLGDVTMRLGDLPGARMYLDQGLELARQLDDKTLLPVGLDSLGELLSREGNPAEARALFKTGLDLSRELGDKRLIADLLLGLASVEDESTARTLIDESLALRRALGDTSEIALTLNRLGMLTTKQGDYAAARMAHAEALSLARRSGANTGLARALIGLADVWCADGHYDRAVTLWAAAEPLRELRWERHLDMHDHERCLDAARVALGDAGFQTCWSAGTVMTVDDAIACALAAR